MSEPVQKPTDLPDKFWDEDAGTVRLEALIKSYCELERRLARAAGEMTETDRDTMLAKLGRPDEPDGYSVACHSPYFKPDPELHARLHALGFTNDQVQAIYDLAGEKLVPMILDMVADTQAEREIERLHDQFGGPEGWQKVARQLLAFGQKNLPPDALAHLSTTYDGVMMMYDLMQGRTNVAGSALMGTGRAAGAEGGDGQLDRLRALMRDPKYWREHDPKIIAKVQEGFERMYSA